MATIIECRGKDGMTRLFEYDLNYDSFKKSWHFQVYEHPRSFYDFFEFEVTLIEDEGVGKVTEIAHHDWPIYISKGIPDKIIEEAAKVLKVTITSSSNNENFKKVYAERREQGATKVWERLKSSGHATYDPLRDIYTFTP